MEDFIFWLEMGLSHILYGGDGHDSLKGGEGASGQYLDGGIGNDTLVASSPGLFEQLLGGDGDDWTCRVFMPLWLLI